jgi:hypothetical protein
MSAATKANSERHKCNNELRISICRMYAHNGDDTSFHVCPGDQRHQSLVWGYSDGTLNGGILEFDHCLVKGGRHFITTPVLYSQPVQ